MEQSRYRPRACALAPLPPQAAAAGVRAGLSDRCAGASTPCRSSLAGLQSSRVLVFLKGHKVICKRTEDTVVALHPEVFRVSYFHRERMCNDFLASLTQEKKR